MFALNLDCSLGATGDWHTSGMNWSKLKLHDTKDSIFGDWGIERSGESKVHVPGKEGHSYNIANHIRACLDLLEEGKFSCVEGMYRDFLDEDDQYNEAIFTRVLLPAKRKPDMWDDLHCFMCREYGMKWFNCAKQKDVPCGKLTIKSR